MYSKKTIYKWMVLLLIVGTWVCPPATPAQDAADKATPAKEAGKERSTTQKSAPNSEPRRITVAVFDVDVVKGVEVDAGALTDQINVILDSLPNVTIVNRDQIKKSAEEHKMSLSGLVDSETAVKLGKFTSAQYVLVGRASKIGATYFLVMKIVDVETTVQTIVSTKASVDNGVEALIERLIPPMTHKITELQQPAMSKEERTALNKLKKDATPLKDKTILLDVPERHLSRPLVDPAAVMALSHRLQSLGIRVVIPKDPADGWKQALLENGKYRDQKIDYLLEGEGISAFAAEIQGLISCRARVELRLIALPGRNVTVSEKGVDSHVDLVEALAAKTALEKAVVRACDAIITRWASQYGRKAKK